MLDTWNEQHEEILKEWKAKCFVHLWLQDASAYYYSDMHNLLSYPVIILSSISSAALFSSNNSIIKYMVGVFALTSGVLTAITRQMKPGELHQQHAMTSRRYHNLIRNIDTCLSLTVNLRPSPNMFIEKLGIEIDTLATSQLDPPLIVLKRFEKKYGTIDRMLYGQDIVELMKIEMHANNMFRKMKKNERKSLSEDGSDLERSKKARYDEQSPRYTNFMRNITTLDAFWSNKRSEANNDITIDITKL